MALWITPLMRALIRATGVSTMSPNTVSHVSGLYMLRGRGDLNSGLSWQRFLRTLRRARSRTPVAIFRIRPYQISANDSCRDLRQQSQETLRQHRRGGRYFI